MNVLENTINGFLELCERLQLELSKKKYDNTETEYQATRLTHQINSMTSDLRYVAELENVLKDAR